MKQDENLQHLSADGTKDVSAHTFDTCFFPACAPITVLGTFRDGTDCAGGDAARATGTD
jgi:hypothetical protein